MCTVVAMSKPILICEDHKIPPFSNVVENMPVVSNNLAKPRVVSYIVYPQIRNRINWWLFVTFSLCAPLQTSASSCRFCALPVSCAKSWGSGPLGTRALWDTFARSASRRLATMEFRIRLRVLSGSQFLKAGRPTSTLPPGCRGLNFLIAYILQLGRAGRNIHQAERL